MNSQEIQSLTKRLAANPNFILETEEKAVRNLLLDYTAGLLDPNVEKEVRELIASDPVAAAMWKDFNDIEARVRSPEGQQWTQEAGERILSNVLEGIDRGSKPIPVPGIGGKASRKIVRFPSAPAQQTAPMELQLAAGV